MKKISLRHSWNRNILLVLGCLCIFNLRIAQAADNAVSLALVAKDPSLSKALDLLTAELSKKEGVSLLERSQIDKIMAEQKLTLGGLGIDNSIKIGRLMGADGVAFLEITQEGTNQVLSTRLIAVQPGVGLTAFNSPWPLKDLTEWTGLVSSKFQPLWPKLRVLPRDAVPISILNFRATASSRQSIQAERQFSQLLLNRLTREPQLFVLERRRLDLLSDEKSLKGSTESNFWNGSYLLEGVIDRDGYSPQTMTLHATLAPPTGGNRLTFEVAGGRADLKGLVAKLASQLLEKLNRTNAAAAWNPEAEAAQFFKEGQWALRWQMFPEAQSAAESAWSLGKQDQEGAILRVRSYLHQIQARSRDLHVHQNDESDPRVWLEFPKPLQPEHLGLAIRSLGYVQDFTISLSTNLPALGSDWYQVGVESLVTASEILREYYYRVNDRPRFESQLAELRQLARAVSTRYLQSTSVQSNYWLAGRIWQKLSHHNRHPPAPSLLPSIAEWGALWQERPEDAIALYRLLMTSERFPEIRPSVFNVQYIPQVVSWRKEDDQRVKSVIQNFTSELLSSTNPLTQIEGQFWQIFMMHDDQKLVEGIKALHQQILSQQERILTNDYPMLFGSALSHLVGVKLNGRSGGRALYDHWYRDYAPPLQQMEEKHEKLLQTKVDAVENAEKLRLASMEAELHFKKQKDFLKSANTDRKELRRLFDFAQFTPPQALELLTLAETTLSNLMARASSDTLSPEETYLISHLRHLKTQLSIKSQPSTNVVRKIVKPASTLVLYQPVPFPESAPLQTTPLEVGAFYKLPQEFKEGERLNGLLGPLVRQEKLWFNMGYNRTEQILEPGRSYNISKELGGLTVFDPSNQKWEVIPAPQLTGMGDPPHPFEVYNGGVFLSLRNGLTRYDIKTRKWTPLPIPSDRLGQFFIVMDRLFLVTAEGIIELLNDGQSSRILASRRRNPPVTTLDQSDRLGAMTLFSDSASGLLAEDGQYFYKWTGENWEKGTNVPSSTRHLILSPNLFSTTYWPGRLWLLDPANSTLELCFEAYPQEAPGISLGQRLSRVANPPAPAWDLLGFPTRDMAVARHQSNICLFLPYTRRMEQENTSFVEKGGRHADLVLLDRALKEPLVVPLRMGQPLTFERGRDIESPFWMVRLANQWWVGHPGMNGFFKIDGEKVDGKFSELRQQKLQAAGQWSELRKKVREKYDLDGDGKYAPMERELLLKDPEALATLWEEIDSNQNGYLDRHDDWKFLDSNANQSLDDPEFAALETLLQVAAKKLMRKFDWNNDQKLNIQELKIMTSREIFLSTSSQLNFDGRRAVVGAEEPDLKAVESLLANIARRSIFLSFHGPPIEEENLFREKVAMILKEGPNFFPIHHPRVSKPPPAKQP